MTDHPSAYSSVLLQRPGAVSAEGPDAGVAAHYGDPVREQRALEEGRAVVDLSHRGVVTVTGPDRLSWLTTLSSQQVSELRPQEASELLLLDISGRIEHWAAITDDGETAWLVTEAGRGAALADWLDSMKFMLRVEIVDRSAECAVLGSVAPLPEAAQQAARHNSPTAEDDADNGAGTNLPLVWGDPWPRLGPGGISYSAVEDAEHPGVAWKWHLTLIAGGDLADVVEAAETADAGGWMLAGAWAAEALRIAAWRPRHGFDVDDKAIPHELDLMRTAVHMSKGCYRGQETIARVHNLGHPPRRLVFLHVDGSEHTLPAAGSEVLAPKDASDAEKLAAERAVGKVTSAIRHHEMGPIALALVKRKVDPQAQLVVRDVLGSSEGDAEETVFYAAAQELIVRPDAGQAVGRPKGDFVRAPRR